MKNLIKELKCTECGKALGEDSLVTESVEYKTLYYATCIECGTGHIATSSRLVNIDDANEDIKDDYYKTNINLLENQINKALESITEKDIKDFLGMLTEAVTEAYKEEVKQEKKETVKKDVKTKKSRYVLLKDGKICDEYISSSDQVPRIYKDLEKEFGIDAIVSEKIMLCELTPIKPSVKKKVVYELEL